MEIQSLNIWNMEVENPIEDPPVCRNNMAIHGTIFLFHCYSVILSILDAAEKVFCRILMGDLFEGSKMVRDEMVQESDCCLFLSLCCS